MDLHLEVLNQSRRELLPLMSGWKEKFYLAGGTALALQLGHRRSYDLDFFTTASSDALLIRFEK